MEEVVELESADKNKMKQQGSCSIEAKLEGSKREPERPLCLKLIKTGAPAPARGNPHIRVCRICKKVFSTGKALGGHMRMHARDPKQEIGNNNLMSESLVHHDGKQNCRVCGKDFPSMKSLFGHMRSHPEREWRGIQPPEPVPVPVPVPSSCSIGSPSSEHSTLSDDLHPIVDSSSDPCAAVAVTTTRPHSEYDSDSDPSVVDLSSRLSMGWSVTAKRGRKGNSGCSYGSGLKPGIERRTEEAMYHLMMLACANPNSNHLTLTHHSDTDDTWEEEEQQTSPKTESKPSASPETSRRMVVMTNKRRRIKRVKLTELETVGSTDISKDQNQNETNKHVCSLCNKSFPTHQALGGHRSSHNKSKFIQNIHSHNKSKFIQNIHNVVESESYDSRLDIATQADVEVINSNGNGQGHQCNICNKIFPTGQALGGHKRCHWTGNAETHAKSAPAETSQAHPPSLLGLIDLNELPAMDEQHQEVNSPSASEFD